jgi:hypothetical protein
MYCFRAGRVCDPQLIRQVVDDHRWHVQRISQERPHIPGRGQQQAEAQPIVVAAPHRDERPIHVIEEEDPFQISATRHAIEPAEPGRFLVGQEVNRHGRQPTADRRSLITASVLDTPVAR